MKGTLSTAVVPAAIPAATAGVVCSPGKTFAATIARGNADRNRRKDRPTPEPGTERQRVGETLGHDEESQHAR